MDLIAEGAMPFAGSRNSASLEEERPKEGALSDKASALVTVALAVVAAGRHRDFRIMLLAFVGYLAADGTAGLDGALASLGAL
jgi:hypothetical protein